MCGTQIETLRLLVVASAFALISAVSCGKKNDIPRLELAGAVLDYAPQVGRNLQARVTLRNRGDAAALGVVSDLSIDGRVKPVPSVVDRLNKPDPNRIDVGPDKSIDVPVTSSAPLAQADFDVLASGAVTIYVYGYVDYRDANGRCYTTEICTVYNPAADPPTPLDLKSCSGQHNFIQRQECR